MPDPTTPTGGHRPWATPTSRHTTHDAANLTRLLVRPPCDEPGCEADVQYLSQAGGYCILHAWANGVIDGKHADE